MTSPVRSAQKWPFPRDLSFDGLASPAVGTRSGEVEGVQVRRALSAAMDDEVGAGCEGREVRGQKEAGVGDVGRLAETAGGDGRRHPLDGGRVAVEALDVVGPHE